MLSAVAAVRAANSAAAYCCDPVIGDVGRGVYVEAGVAEFLRKRALPAATVATPNAFELSFVTGLVVDDVAAARRAIAALQTTGPHVVLATSLALNDTPSDALDMIAAEDGEAWRLRTPLLPIAVNGAGDLIAALFFFHWLQRRSAADALAAAAASVYGIVAATAAAGARELRLAEAQDELVRPTRRFRPEPI